VNKESSWRSANLLAAVMNSPMFFVAYSRGVASSQDWEQVAKDPTAGGGGGLIQESPVDELAAEKVEQCQDVSPSVSRGRSRGQEWPAISSCAISRASGSASGAVMPGVKRGSIGPTGRDGNRNRQHLYRKCGV